MTSRDPRSKGEPTQDTAPPWTRGSAVEVLRNSWKDDAELLDDLFQLHKLAARHPVRQWWETPSSEARYRLHHLADDLRSVRDVDGFSSLLRQMRRNAEGFPDFRFELHLAGALARSKLQRVLSLGGDSSGPDIVTSIRSGHTIGVACYRAASFAPAIVALSRSTRVIVEKLTVAILARASQDQMLAVTFPTFPVDEADVPRARELTRRILVELNVAALEDAGVRVSRHALPEGGRHEPMSVRVRLRLQFPVPSWEKERVSETIREKLAREAASWASKFSGVPMFAVEESMFGQDISKELSALVAGETPFLGAIGIYPAVTPDENGVHHGLEDVHAVFRTEERQDRLDIGIETFGDNVESWSKGFARVELSPDATWEDWDIVRRPRGNVVVRVEPLGYVRSFARVPYSSGVESFQDPGLTERLLAASMRLLAE